MSNLPADLSSFVGRVSELGQLRRVLRDTRLLTLTGPGGVGKTRLATRLARSVAGGYPDGVWLVELAPLTDPHLVPHVLAGTFGIEVQGTSGVLSALNDFLLDKELLLVLDNCEHLVSACAEVAEALLRASPGLRVLATSREPLGCSGETVCRVDPLQLPDGYGVTAKHLSRCDSIRMFVERARAIRPAFTMSDQNAPDVASICRCVDGLPLGIELAAAQIGVLSPKEIAERLRYRLQLPPNGRRTAPARHQTLRATIDWSYELLSEPERWLFDRLSLFAGGCTLDSAEAVCSGELISPTHMLDVLGKLIAKSMVVAHSDSSGHTRYVLLETLRQYAREQLELRGCLEQCLRAHATYYLALATAGGMGGLTRGDQVAWLERFDQEHDNLRAALGWAIEVEDTDIAVQFGAAMWRFWRYRAHLAEAERWLDRVLALPRQQTRNGAFLLGGAGFIALSQGALAKARQRFEEERQVSQAVGYHDAVAGALTQLGHLAQADDDYLEAERLYTEALAVNRACGNRWQSSNTLLGLGRLSQHRRDFGAARDWYSQALDVARELGDHMLLGNALRHIGYLELNDSKLAQARALFTQAIHEDQRIALTESLLNDLAAFGTLGMAEHNPTQALRLLAAAVSAAEENGFGGMPRVWEPRIAWARQALGTSAEACWRAGRSLSLDQAIEEAVQGSGRRPVRVTSLPAGLTQRQAEVLRHVAAGRTNREIASQLVVAESTVERHVANVFLKLSVNTRAAAAAFAYEHQLFDA